MKILRILCLCLPLFAGSVFGRALNLWVEPMWMVGENNILHRDSINGEPNDKKTMWGFGGNLSWMPSSNIAIGPTATFSWSSFREREKSENGRADTLLNRETVIALPIGMTITVDPIPQFMIHPVGHLTLGYNSVFIRNTDHTKPSNNPAPDATIEEGFITNIKDEDGYYNGVYIKFGAEVMVDLGKQFSLFAGPQWQISTVTRVGGKGKLERNFNMMGFRFGVSVLL